MNFIRANYYSFDTIAPTFIGSRYTDMKLIDILSFESAIIRRSDLVTINQQIKDNVAIAAELRATDLTYLDFQDSAGKRIVLAKEWIDANGFVDITLAGGYQNVLINIQNASADDLATISNAIRSVGSWNFDITTQ